MKNKILLAFLVGSAAGVAAGCQTYDFEPVEPLAIAQTTQSKTVIGRQLKPNLMFLIDKSGSMNFAADDSVAPCTSKCNQSGFPACAAGCPTRLQALKLAMNTFLTANNTIAWMGMAVFPTAVAGASGSVDACGATSAADVRVQLNAQAADLSADLMASASAVNTQIQALTVGGGTPTGDSLKFLGGYSPLLDPDPKLPREDFVLLLTDGLPNCNSMNANSCTGTNCRCTLVPATSCMPASYCTQGCLDKDNSAAQVTALRGTGKNIRTIVIGFGAETASGDGPDTLNAMAEAGGFARQCINGTDAECGTGNTCNVATKLCNRKFFQATNANELAAALAEISKAIDPAGICNYTLDEVPADPKFLAVLIDGKNEPGGTPDTWTYSAGKVSFTGALCDKVKAATPIDPVRVEFRIVNTL
ncbi:MAG: cglB [Myxococcaceae bacterium]|nr:cglB [Myxococcaceae bacterium]